MPNIVNCDLTNFKNNRPSVIIINFVEQKCNFRNYLTFVHCRYIKKKVVEVENLKQTPKALHIFPVRRGREFSSGKDRRNFLWFDHRTDVLYKYGI